MSITDELREWADGNALCAGMSLRTARDQALDIADRIDVEHELEVAEAHANGMHEGFAADKGPRDFVELPKDADGEYIHFGDVLDQFGTPMTVFAMSDPDPDQGDCMLELITDGTRDGMWVRARKMHHYHAPTVEDVLREFADGIKDQNADFTELVIAEYAKRLRLAGDAS